MALLYAFYGVLRLVRRFNLNLLLFTVMWLVSGWAYAITPSVISVHIPNSTNPSIISQSQQPGFELPKASAHTRVGTNNISTSKPIEGAEQLQFTLHVIELSGNTAITSAELSKLYQSYLGKKISLAKLQEIVDNITANYRRQGYVLSQAILPAQKIDHGIVKIQIIEGYINQVSIEGKVDARLAKLLQDIGVHIQASHPLKASVLERYALLINDLPGVTVKTIITPDNTKLGAANLIFVVQQQKVSFDANYDNSGTLWMGPFEYGVGTQLNGLLHAGDATTFNVLTSNDLKELSYFGLSHDTPLGTDGTRLNIVTSYTHTHPGFTLKPYDILGDSYTLATSIIHPLLRDRDENFYVRGGINLLNSRNDILSEGLNEDRTRSINLGFDYNRYDHWQGVNVISTHVTQGLDILGARMNGTDMLPLSRPNGHADFTKFSASLSRLQYLPAQFSILLSTTSQYALNPLLSADQFTFGGSQYGTAYDPAELIGDSGAAGKLELRRDFQITNSQLFKSLQLFTHYDVGIVWNRDTSNGQVPRATATSIGTGLRVNVMNYFNAEFELAKPLTYRVNAQLLDGQSGKQVEFLFTLKAHL